jgi:hypothetical protein
MRDPPDLQTAMYYARAFERHTAAMQPTPLLRAARPAPRPGQPPPAQAGGGVPAGHAPAAANAAPAARPFRRLTSAEQQERRRQGLCYNCDEPYVPGHVCQRLFYLEAADYIEDDAVPDNGDGAAAPQEEPAAQEHVVANALVVSLHALAGIRTENTMLLPVMVKGERFLALLDTGSTHNFLQGATMRRLGLTPTGGSSSASPSPTAIACAARASRAMSPSASGARLSPSPASASTWAAWAASTSSSASTTSGPWGPSFGTSRP